MAGYSSTPLGKKLGIREGSDINLINAPEYYFDLFSDMPGGITFEDSPEIKKDFIHLFVPSKDDYFIQLPELKYQLKPDGMIWASWPKKSSKVDTDITENIIRDYALQIGLVDIKVCAIDEIWSGLKLVIPVKDRGSSI